MHDDGPVRDREVDGWPPELPAKKVELPPGRPIRQDIGSAELAALATGYVIKAALDGVVLLQVPSRLTSDNGSLP